MSPLNKACIIIGILIVLASLCLYFKASADDGSLISNCPDWDGNSRMFCAAFNHFSIQNQILIQEQNQTNKLLAYQFCAHGNFDLPDDYGWVRENGFGNFHFKDCVNKILSDTK